VEERARYLLHETVRTGASAIDLNTKPHPTRTSYARQWRLTGVLAVLCLAVFAAVRFRKPAEPPPLPPADQRAYVDWFQLVGLPEMVGEPGRDEAYREMISGWIGEMRREDFLVLPFSRLMGRLLRGEAVPEKSVVLLFEPGYRVTYEALSSTLEKLEAPVAWVTEDPGRYLTDRRFVTPHQREVMSRTGRWDVGMRGAQGDSFDLPVSDEDPAAKRGFRWARDVGRYGINRSGSLDELNRLNANTVWSGRELADRMLAEVPLRLPTPLAARTIQGRLWGTIPGRDDARPTAFDLHADLQNRGASIWWLGMRGVADFRLRFSVRELHGELWILLRSNPAAERRLYVGIVGDRVLVDAENGGSRRRLASTPFAVPSGGGFKGSLRLEGKRLEVACEGLEVLTVEDVGVEATPGCLLELNALDRLRGAARASGIELDMEPIGASAATGGTGT
jgi:hypothetical protein